ncbi:MAG: hypothetical protein ACWGPS_06865 [Candidatus Promineifilaceae bacterium]
MTAENVQMVESGAARELRSIGMAVLFWGLINIITPSLSNEFGVVLIILGAASYYFGTAAMFVVYTVILASAAVTNLFAPDLFLRGFAAVMFVGAVQLFRRFRRYRLREAQLRGVPLEASADPAGWMAATRAARLLPIAAASLAAVSVAGFVASLLAGVVWVLATGDADPPAIILFFMGLAMEVSILGAGVGLASILSGYRLKGLSILGIVVGVAALLLEIIFGLQAPPT